MTGCVRTETVIVTETVPAIPPTYLYDAERVPEVPDGLPPEERTAHLLEAFAARGDAIKRDQTQAQKMEKWVQEIRKLYPKALEHPLPEGSAGQ